VAARYRRIGDSELEVSEISLGSWLTYGGGVGNDQARACVDAAFAAGINFIDTANVYTLGESESFLGEVLQSRPRDSYVLATKRYFPMDDSGENHGLSRGQVLKQIDESLARLRTDHVDLYQCHRYDTETPSRGRWLRSPRSSGPARLARSASANGAPSRSKPRST
jgi:aryl-alcohol dehydrogenase-like predicted oxidoreductase